MHSNFFAHARNVDLVIVIVDNGAERAVMEREDALDEHGYARIVASVSALREPSQIETDWRGVETAREWYEAYGLDYVVEREHGEETLRVTDEVGYSDLDGDDGDILVSLTDERGHGEEAAEGLLAAARRVRAEADRIAELCRDAKDAAVAGDLGGCLQALDEAYRTEADHGDCPMTLSTARACLRAELFI